MAVTLRDVAKRAGVSAMTVSRVVNGGGGVDPETQRKVEDAILALDYVPNRLARGLISHKSKTIGLIVPDVVNPFFAPVVRGAETTARKAGYRVLLCNSEADLRLEREYIEDLIAHRIEGLLIAPATDRSRVSLLALQKSGFPIVLLDRSLPDFDWPRLREDFPEQFENPVDSSLEPTGWVRLRVAVDPYKLQIFVGSVTQPTLEVRKLGELDGGQVGLWVGNDSGGDFANLVITPTK